MHASVTAGIPRTLRRLLVAGSAFAASAMASPFASACAQEVETTEEIQESTEDAGSDDSEPSEEEMEAQVRAQLQELLSTLRIREGSIDLGSGLAEFDTGADLRFIPSPDSGKILTDVWGNPPGDELGLIVPFPFDPLDESGWAIIVDYEDDGHVGDDDAEDIDYDDLLESMQKGAKEANPKREEAGFPTVEVLGWAEPPKYDATAKTLYWAKELRFSGVDANVLNYNLRILGREGVLVLNVMGGMEELANIKAATPDLLKRVRFQEGSRYEDFDESKDKVAAYGITGLILGGVAAKTGLFKLLIAGILAAKKVLVVAVLGVGAWLGKVFKGKKSESEPESGAK